MLLRGIANQKQFQSLVERVIPQVRLGHGEGLDQPGQIFLRLDISRIEHERIGYRVAFQNAVGVGGHWLPQEPFVERVVDDLDFFLGNAEPAGEIPLGRMRNSHDAVRARARRAKYMRPACTRGDAPTRGASTSVKSCTVITRREGTTAGA